MEGVVAWGAHFPNSAVASHSYHPWLSTAQVEEALGTVMVAAKNLGSHGIHPLQLCSIFEHFRIYLSLREDGVCLGLFVENRPAQSTDALNRLLEEFRVTAI